MKYKKKYHKYKFYWRCIKWFLGLFMNPYGKYLSIDYEKLSEEEMMKSLHGVFNIDPSVRNGLFDEAKHYTIVESIIQTSLKLKYETVCDELRKIYPLSFPMREESYPKTPFEDERKIESIANIAPPIPIYHETDTERKSVDDLNKLTNSFRNN